MSVQEPRPVRFTTTSREFIEDVITTRQRLGLDQRDEVWDGEYHMSPLAGIEHQRIVLRLASFLLAVADQHKLGAVFAGTNVRRPGSGKRDFRVPDVVFVSNARRSILSDVACEGGPDVLFEIHSDDDESYLKKRFYAEQGVLEFFVVDVATKRVELFKPSKGEMVETAAGADGWFRSEPLGVELRRVEKPGDPPALEVRDARSPTWSVLI